MQTSVESVTEKLTATEIEEKIRKTGIDVIGDAPWGTHFCQFYETKEDLVDVLVPYFKAGLENNEFCMWVTSEPLSEEEAREAMRKAVPNFDRYLKRGQIQIVPYTEWYLKGGAFNLQRVLNGWVEKLNQALAQGYDGMRVTGNTAWLEKRTWKNFVDYEQEVNDVINKYQMIALCTYSLDKCGASEIIDVVSNHQFALIRQESEWKLIESSEIKRAEETLRESEERYRELTESISDVFFAMDKDLRYTYWNKASEKLTGVSAKDVAGKSLTEVFPDVKGTKVERFYIETLRTQQPQSFVNEFRLGGKNYVFEINAYPTKDGLSVFVKDITERKRAEEELIRLSSAVKMSTDSIVISDLDGKIIDVNEATLKMYDTDYKRDLIGKNSFDLIAPEEREKALVGTKEVLERGYVKNREYHVVTKDGSRISVEMSASIMKDVDGKPIGFVGISRDVSERKQMELALKQSEEKYRKLVENSKDSIVVIDLNGNVQFANKVTEELTGFTSEDGIRMNVRKITPLKYWPKSLAMLLKARKGEQIPYFESMIRRKDGKLIPVESGGQAIFKDGKVVGIQIITRDITERKKLEKRLKEYSEHVEEKVEERTNQLKKAQEQLLKAERLAAIGEVATMVGHDLRNPLQAITNAVYFLKDSGTTMDSVLTNERYKEYLDLVPEPTRNEFHEKSAKIVKIHSMMINAIDESVKYADKIVSDLQDFARTTEHEPIEINLESLIQETLSGISIPKNVKISMKHDQRLSKVYVDPNQLRRVFTNLTTNAIQAMKNGGTLTISTNKTNGFLEVSFKDTGVGIPKENMEKLFLLLFTTKAKGTGMGLPVCKKLVEMHGGTIKVESEIGKGTTVTVKLPITKENGGEKT